jgi:Fis family transcriptional regulator
MNGSIDAPAVTLATLCVDNTHEREPLRDCVRDAVENYFDQLGNHSTGGLYDLVIREVEEPLLECVLRQTQGNQSRAAELLGINRGTLRKKLKSYGMDDRS